MLSRHHFTDPFVQSRQASVETVPVDIDDPSTTELVGKYEVGDIQMFVPFIRYHRVPVSHPPIHSEPRGHRVLWLPLIPRQVTEEPWMHLHVFSIGRQNENCPWGISSVHIFSWWALEPSWSPSIRFQVFQEQSKTLVIVYFL